MTSMYEQFKTDAELERNGVEIDYGDFRVTVARAGGANKRFARVLESKSKPYRRAIQTETMNLELSIGLLREVYAEAIILRWETKVNEEWLIGIEPPPDVDLEAVELTNEGLLAFTRDNIVEVFTLLPDLFQDLQEQAQKIAMYRSHILDIDAGN